MSFTKKTFPDSYNYFISDNDKLLFQDIFNDLNNYLLNIINIKKRYIKKRELNDFYNYITELFKNKVEETRSDIINDYYNNVKLSIKLLNANNGFFNFDGYTNKDKIFFIFRQIFNSLEYRE